VSRSKFATIIDGTSNTLLIGEKHVRPNSFQGKNEDRSIFDGEPGNAFRRFIGRAIAGAPTSPPNFDPADPPNPLIADPATQANPTDPVSGLTISVNQCFGSRHSGICQFVFCDGSVKGLRVSLSIEQLTFLGLPDDGQAIPGSWD
jgi:prepilin-type processing-associated H-X9-DG protein